MERNDDDRLRILDKHIRTGDLWKENRPGVPGPRPCAWPNNPWNRSSCPTRHHHPYLALAEKDLGFLRGRAAEFRRDLIRLAEESEPADSASSRSTSRSSLHLWRRAASPKGQRMRRVWILAMAGLWSCGLDRQAGGSTSETSNGLQVRVVGADGQPAARTRVRIRPADYLAQEWTRLTRPRASSTR
ncbi:MAG: hypothetical protein IPN71_12975 [Fibrobacteres bacterium]|nr:hypothetical protein [Fibrobacterota bacterium]